jgi:excisionase family DNA binding protein
MGYETAWPQATRLPQHSPEALIWPLASGPMAQRRQNRFIWLVRPIRAIFQEIWHFPWCGRFCGPFCGRPQRNLGCMTTNSAFTFTPSSTASTSPDRLVFTVAEAGQILGISRAFAYELVARGELPVIRLGRRRLVPKVALLALVGAGGSPLAADLGPGMDSDDHN